MRSWDVSKALNHFAVSIMLKNVVIKVETLNELVWADWLAHCAMMPPFYPNCKCRTPKNFPLRMVCGLAMSGPGWWIEYAGHPSLGSASDKYFTYRSILEAGGPVVIAWWRRVGLCTSNSFFNHNASYA